MGINPDWTSDARGRSNNSIVFYQIVGDVERLIRESAHALINGRAQDVALLIVAQLAHVHHLRPELPHE